MSQGYISTMRLGTKRWIRLLATGLLVTMALPTALEVRRHPETQEAPLAHAEALNFQHHADDCLAGVAALEGTLPRPHRLVDATLAPEPVANPTCQSGHATAEPTLRPSSRAPPAPVVA